MAGTDDLRYVDLSNIHEPDEALRKVDRKDEKYQGLVESVRLKGIMNPITLREIVEPETNQVTYGLVDGLQRYSAAKDAGLERIPAHIISVEDAELLEAQIIANVHKIETKPVEYSKALLKVLQNNPLLTRSDLANRLAKTPAWISERLGLLKLTDQVGELVDEGKIGLSNAYALAKLPPEEQVDFVDRALTMTPQQFAPTVNARVKELRDSKRKGKDAGPAEFQPVAILRGRAEIISELERPQVMPGLLTNVTDPSEAAKMALKWTLNLDPVSVEIQRAKDEERRAERDRLKEKAKVERMRKRAKEAAEKAAELQKQAETLSEEEVEV